MATGDWVGGHLEQSTGPRHRDRLGSVPRRGLDVIPSGWHSAVRDIAACRMAVKRKGTETGNHQVRIFLKLIQQGTSALLCRQLHLCARPANDSSPSRPILGTMRRLHVSDPIPAQPIRAASYGSPPNCPPTRAAPPAIPWQSAQICLREPRVRYARALPVVRSRLSGMA